MQNKVFWISLSLESGFYVTIFSIGLSKRFILINSKPWRILRIISSCYTAVRCFYRVLQTTWPAFVALK